MIEWLQYALPLVAVGACAWWPCRCTPPVDCTICSDDFNRADGTDIDTGSACGWTEASGSWSIASNYLTTSSTNSIALCDTDATSPQFALDVDIYATNSGNILQAIVGYVDSTHYWIVQVQFSTTAGRILLIQRSGATFTTQGFSNTNLNLAASTWYTLRVCTNSTSGNLTASIDGKPGSYCAFAANITDATVGLGGGGTITGSVRFDNFVLSDYSGDCPCRVTPLVNCSACKDSAISASWAIVMNFADVDCNCAALRATYYKNVAAPGAPCAVGDFVIFPRKRATGSCITLTVDSGGFLGGTGRLGWTAGKAKMEFYESSAGGVEILYEPSSPESPFDCTISRTLVWQSGPAPKVNTACGWTSGTVDLIPIAP
jgi:hypothetical protein